MQSIADGKNSSPCLNFSLFPWAKFTCCLLESQLSILFRFYFPPPCSFLSEYKKARNEAKQLPQ